MKCPFCASENPAHANFCMECGAPQDLKACEACGTINRKTAAQCHGCNIQLSQLHPEKSVPSMALSSADHIEETEALAKETLTFKQLLAELEEDVKRQFSEASPPRTEESLPPTQVPSKTNILLASIDAPIIAEPPTYLQHLLPERVTKSEHNRLGWWLFIILVLLVAIGIGYFAVMEYDLFTLNNPTTAENLQPKSTIPDSEQISTAQPEPPAPVAQPAGLNE